jgi:hypothetical protein
MSNYIPISEPRSPAEMQSLSKDDTTRLIAQRNEVSSRATLVGSLIILGRFYDALAITEDEEKRQWIVKLIKAEERDDEHRCKCESSTDVQDYARMELAGIKEPEPILNPTPNYIRTYRHWSSKYNEMVSFYQCQECGCVQTLPDSKDISELNAQHYKIKQEALHAALKAGIPIRRL